MPVPAPAEPHVWISEIRQSTFQPHIQIPAGVAVLWINRDAVPHTVSDERGSFDSPFMGADQFYQQLFITPGTYTYFCRVHQGMAATVEVR